MRARVGSAAGAVGALLSAGLCLAAPPGQFEIAGQVAGAGGVTLRVTLFGVSEPYTATTSTDDFGEFRFHGLRAGDYTVSVLQPSLGAVRRTVVVSPSLADRKGAIHVGIHFLPAEAAGVRGGTVSANSLAVPERARKKADAARRLLQKREVEGAKAELQEAVAVAPKFAQAWNMLGMIEYQTHNLPAAEENFRKAVEADPSAFEPVANLAGVLLSESRYQESLRYDQQALAMRPADPLANVQAGIAYFALRDYGRAQAALLKTWEVDPSHFSKPQLFLADICLLRGDLDTAVKLLQDYADRHPDADDAARVRRRIEKLKQAAKPRE